MRAVDPILPTEPDVHLLRTGRGEALRFLLAHVGTPHSESDPCVAWPFRIADDGYAVIRIGGRARAAHRLLLELREGPPPEGKPLALHGDCNNRGCIVHSRWGSAAENQADRRRDNTLTNGERHPQAKLTAVDARMIRSMFADGVRGRTIAQWFRVSPSTVSSIVTGLHWREA